MFGRTSIMPIKFENEFSKPVESIMRCDDFKSNFARKLSNRYISRTPISVKPDSSLKLVNNEDPKTVPANALESVATSPQLSKNISSEQRGEIKPADKSTTSSDIRNTEVNALNMEVETLRWQLTQTEANRQMHIALLRQIVAFLNRVKEHIQFENKDGSKQGLLSSQLAKSFNFADLPRSRSVLHVNKTQEYALSTPKRSSTRKISKSVSNVNGFKECHGGAWTQSKLSLSTETETNPKLTEEIVRLITLANTVLSTNLPDLACNCKQPVDTVKPEENENLIENDVSVVIKPLVSNSNNENNNMSIEDDIKDVTALSKVDEKDGNGIKCFESQTSLISFEDKLTNNSNLHDTDKSNLFNRHNCSDSPIPKTRITSIKKKNEYNSSIYIEDESGFSSMNSFQEIGIPIISIIPPSPCKEMAFVEEIPDLLDGTSKWKTETLEIDKQSVKVFWV